jgi:hypothetical protein
MNQKKKEKMIKCGACPLHFKGSAKKEAKTLEKLKTLANCNRMLKRKTVSAIDTSNRKNTNMKTKMLLASDHSAAGAAPALASSSLRSFSPL